MKIKGLVRLEFVDQETGETRVEERENFIFRETFPQIFFTTKTFNQIAIAGYDTLIYPVATREKKFYETSLYYGGSNRNTLVYGTNNAVKFFDKTDESPAFLEYYSLFHPSTKTVTIPAIVLADGYQTSSSRDMSYAYSCINLLPPCSQTQTEYLNIYYRLILMEEELDNDISQWLRSYMLNVVGGRVLNATRIHDSSSATFYPFRLDQSMSGKDRLLNHFDDVKYSNSVAEENLYNIHQYNKERLMNRPLQYAEFRRFNPPQAPNQYTQMIGTYHNTLMRGAGAGSGYQRLIYPFVDQYIKTAQEGNTGIGNVFATKGTSDSPFFDPQGFSVGTGRMYASGQWDGYQRKDVAASRFVVEIMKSGKTASDMQYRVREYHQVANAPLVLIPSITMNATGKTWYEGYEIAKKETTAIQKADRIHVYPYNPPVKFKEGRSFITFDKTGIMIYDIYHGRLDVFDSQSNPPLGATDISDVKVDADGLIWIACKSTGLWTLKIDEEQNLKEMTHISAPPGCQPRVYAIDADNFGNVWAIWWGLGLHYTSDKGQTWVNSIINFPEFSEYDNGGLDSKWRRVSRLYCNPHRDARNGDGQILILKSSTEDYNNITGCWYDQISADTTGITSSSMKNPVFDGWVNSTRGGVAVCKRSDRWYFHGGQSSDYYWMPFKHNSSPNGIPRISHPISRNNIARPFYEEMWDEEAGQLKDYIHFANASGGSVTVDGATAVPIRNYTSINEPSGHHEDFGTNEASYWSASSACMLSKNVIVTPLLFQNDQNNRIVTCQYRIAVMQLPNKINKAATSTIWGWDGGQWVKNFVGYKAGHTDAQDFTRGVQLRFENGPSTTESFVVTDQYTFTCFDGFYKDNSTKMWFRDSVWCKGTEQVLETTPNVVTLVDKRSETGLLNDPTIAVDWDISQLPDTTYEGSAVTDADGDELFGTVSYLLPMDKPEFVDVRYKRRPTTAGVELTSEIEKEWEDGAKPVFKFSGDRPRISLAKVTGYNDLINVDTPNTIEAWVYPTSRDEMVFYEFADGNSGFYLYLLKSGAVGLASASENEKFGGVGQSVNLNDWNHVSVAITKTEATCHVNGIEAWSAPVNNIMYGWGSLNIGSRSAIRKMWDFTNINSFNKVDTQQPPLSDIGVYEIQNGYNTDFGLNINWNLATSEHTFSVYVKPQNSREKIKLVMGNYSAQFTAETMLVTESNVEEGKAKITQANNGWYRLSLTATVGGNVTFRITGDIYTNFFVSGIMLNRGDQPSGYTTGSANLFGDASKHPLGTYRPFHGYMAGVRMTKGVQRYEKGNFNVANRPFPVKPNSYVGSRLLVKNSHPQGLIRAKKELVGDWEVVFSDFDVKMMESIDGRVPLFFGITSSVQVEGPMDIGYRCYGGWSGSNRTLIHASWDVPYSSGQGIYQMERPHEVKMMKAGNRVQIHFKTKNSGWYKVAEYNDFAGYHYIVFWKERPNKDVSVPMPCPAVRIIKNGADYVAKVGKQSELTGVFNPKFIGVDNSWEELHHISLDGNPVNKKRTQFADEGNPNANETMLHGHGSIRFHPSDVGKAITCKITSIYG